MVQHFKWTISKTKFYLQLTIQTADIGEKWNLSRKFTTYFTFFCVPKTTFLCPQKQRY